MSIRNKCANNINNSKNTRMDIQRSLEILDIRKDELMHINRYLRTGDVIKELATKLGRPLKILDIGCGEIYVARTFYKSFITKKSDYFSEYVGVDIDDKNLYKVREKYKNVIDIMNITLLCADLTTTELHFDDQYFDLICCFEVAEHIHPRFFRGLLKQLNRVLSTDGIILFSTPNADGSNKKLPVDHIYEYPYDELKMKLSKFFHIKSETGMCINLKNVKEIPKQFQGFSKLFTSIAMAPLSDTRICKNILWELIKRGY
jgi:SAM-dependent methyltransferase